jgi:predicted Zn-dependent protease with MMP-like domain
MQATPTQFESLVAQALDALPQEIRIHVDNLVLTIAEWPTMADVRTLGLTSPYQLLGLYQGIPLPRRGRHYNLALPDRITLYRGPILAQGGPPEAIRRRIEVTVVHEIAHHFGIDDERLAQLGY